ncbi:hypothetical protein BJ875DRAFT_527621 [Amylocarpus encephaloides]|uniref:DUF7924 domain-containing protein n=1 Tax=Amylocarpus encephaloides TaxID=45428 RepID=A0A9P7Y8C0_9HELO|nr:hypothetical protein BJ875DRAFT_527621 [Amylocarpus encephaloides]
MDHLLVRKKSSTSSSDQKPRDAKSAPYQNARYENILATKGSFIGKSELDATAKSKSLCRTLLETKQTFPDDSLFRDNLFEEAYEMVRNKNEARVVRDISSFMVPSAEILAIRGAKHLKILIESVNEGWNNSIPITKTRPKPDYSVLKRIEPFVGELTDTSFFMATYSMYFPFLTYEAKCSAIAFDIAVGGIVELFRLVKREKELYREILAFLISYDQRTVRIYGHYPIIKGNETTFYRHLIRTFDFTELDGKEKWTAYQFTKNIYDLWMLTHLKRICSVIEELPSHINFEVSERSELTESGLSQSLESHHISRQSSHDGASMLEEADSS